MSNVYSDCGYEGCEAPARMDTDRCAKHTPKRRKRPARRAMSATRLARGEFYPIADIGRLPRIQERGQMHARWTGEFRAPKAGEWYLSGAIIEAYCMLHESAIKYPIAELVPTETKTVIRERKP